MLGSICHINPTINRELREAVFIQIIDLSSSFKNYKTHTVFQEGIFIISWYNTKLKTKNGGTTGDKITNSSSLKKIETADPFTIPKAINNNSRNMMICSSAFGEFQNIFFVPT